MSFRPRKREIDWGNSKESAETGPGPDLGKLALHGIGKECSFSVNCALSNRLPYRRKCNRCLPYIIYNVKSQCIVDQYVKYKIIKVLNLEDYL